MNIVSLTDIANLSIFNNLNTTTLENLRCKATKFKLDKGRLLFFEKDIVNSVYIVLEGKVSLFRTLADGHKKIFFILNEGEIINEVIFDNLPTSVSCEAFDDSIILAFNKTDLLNIMSTDFQLTEKIINHMSKKIRRLYRQLKNTVPIKVDKRVAAKLWKLSKDYGIELEDGTLIDLNISISYLADMIGSARETISRCLRKLEKNGLIKFEGKKIIVINIKNLSKYFKE
ncbi:MAG: Crp/Fnr family transcriptional regulator [Clostridium sp.]|uniref:Crp/Fnr family transcriptional regulator n=1 Tax=Clostridium sp. TaxID=1506 RepID=UPI0025BC9D2C|nr:Crp/Fnr family transcriptional regulator [Clostridium sp.]MCE5221269.1 Crp/Fnr family transcriptional regulator [Clostridium sp.]